MKKSALEKRVAELENTIRMMQIVIDSLERDKQDKPVVYRGSTPEVRHSILDSGDWEAVWPGWKATYGAGPWVRPGIRQ